LRPAFAGEGVYRQAKESSPVLKMGIPEGEDIDISLLEHVSPIELGKRHSLRSVCAQPGRHSLKPTLKGYFYTNLVGTLITNQIQCMADSAPISVRYI